MLPEMKNALKEGIAYGMLVIGVSFDHITTERGLKSPKIYETNPLALLLMQNNIWWLFDVCLITSFIICTYILIRMFAPRKYCLLSLPLATGIIRFCVGIWNFSLILQIL